LLTQAQKLKKDLEEVGFKPAVQPLSYFEDDYGLKGDDQDEDEADDDDDYDEEDDDNDDDEQDDDTRGGAEQV
jgi:hypothetical protein